MSSQVEHLFGPHIETADAFAREQGWRLCSRVSWLKRDGGLFPGWNDRAAAEAMGVSFQWGQRSC